MRKKERHLAYIITLCFWGVMVDVTIENPAPVWAAVLMSNFATLVSVFTILIIKHYGKKQGNSIL